MSRRPRGLNPDERDLWHRIAATARPMHPDHPVRPDRTDKEPPRKPKPAAVGGFRLGETARKKPKPHDLAPGPGQHLAAQPLRMDKGAYDKMMRGKLKPEARIDLHGMTLAEAHPELIGFILGAHTAGKRLVLVITGKGKIRDDYGPIPQRVGALRHQVPHWLAAPPLGSAILQITPASQKHGGEGAYYVYLRRQR
ncbi:MAG: Smr/MutS family protein [Albidovulum sp.]|jgi:DNA-nicking Smr family endonuclease